MRRFAVLGLAGLLAFVLSSCFMLQGFVLVDSSLDPGQSTIARFTVRPFSTTEDRHHQFFLVGVDDTADLGVGKGTWGTNGNYGGPTPLNVEPTLAAAIDADGGCTGSGFDFGSIYGSFTWKSFMTANKVNDRGTPGVTSRVDIVLKAKAAAPAESLNTVVAITGAWEDDGDDVFDSDDTFTCTGNATTFTYINP